MWLYVPETSSPCAPELEDSNSASNSPLPIGERLAEASAMWRGKPQPPQAWSRRWKQGGFIRLLSGLTCSPSTLDRGVASFISSLRAIPAKTTALPESAPEPMANGSLLPKSAALLKSAGLILSSARTCRGTRTDSLQPSSRHWSDWATALRQEYSARPRPEIPCDASDCSSWPSARAVDSESSGRRQGRGVSDTLTAVTREWIAPVADDTGARTKRYGQGGMALSMQADQWIAPRTITGGAETAERKKELGRTESGGGDLQAQANNWPGPAARDHKGINSPAHLEVSTGSLHLDQLPNFVEYCFHPPSSPDRLIAGGSTSSTDSPNSNQPSAKRKLNPIFVEALMRWPTGLSGFERQETAWTRWWQLQLSYLSALVSASSTEPTQGDLF